MSTPDYILALTSLACRLYTIRRLLIERDLKELCARTVNTRKQDLDKLISFSFESLSIKRRRMVYAWVQSTGERGKNYDVIWR